MNAIEYLEQLHPPAARIAVLVRHPEKGTVQRILSVKSAMSETFQQWLRECNEAGADVYVSMNPLKMDAMNRTKSNIHKARHLWLDLDTNADESLAAVRTSLPIPNFVLNTSPGKYQVVWNVAGFSLESAEATLQTLASQFGGDRAAVDVSRVLRLPSFLNRKYTPPFVVQAAQESTSRYLPEDFPKPSSPHAHTMPKPPKVPGPVSQSEKDWAYALRSIARGMSPEQIVQKIAAYRFGEKSNVQKYAERTVRAAMMKAQKNRLATVCGR